MARQKHLLVIRFSALGDVAMTVPVVKNMLEQYPDVQITFVSTAFVGPLFQEIERCRFIPAFLHGKHNGLWGMVRLFRELRSLQKFDYVVDLHDVLRSKMLRFLWAVNGTKSVHINKGRKEKRQLTRKKNKILRQLKTSFQRYADTFARAGFPITLDNSKPILKARQMPESFMNQINPEKKFLLGVAPFSKHEGKMYPLDKMKNLLMSLNQVGNVQLIFLGSKQESTLLQEWAKEIPGSINVAGKYSFEEELGIISNLSLVLSMDSANVHLASLFKVPVITVWGETHPFAGFQGWGQPDSHNVQLDIPCRPSSIYGQKKHFRKKDDCMVWMSEQVILDKIKTLI